MNLASYNTWKTFFICSFALASCVKSLDIAPPAHISQNVLVGVLHPDSSIKIRIFKTLPSISKENNYEGINNLVVNIFEDKNQKIVLKSTGNGYYSTNIKPKAGHFYAIEAIISENNILTAQDSIPIFELPLIQLTKPNPDNYNSNPDVIFTKNTNRQPYYWFSLNFSKKNINSPLTILSDSPYLDIFNSKINNIDGRRDYEVITRIKPDMPLGKEIRIGFVNSIKDTDAAYLYISCLSSNYDKYLKTAITAYQNSLVDNAGDLKNPFGDFLPVYSNVKNGLGIFVGYNSKKVLLK